MAGIIDQESREWLLGALSGLVDTKGEHRFLNAPLLEPTSRFFPDEWEPSIRGVEVVLKRLLMYAGLEDLQPEVRSFSKPDDIYELNTFGNVKSWGHDGAAAWFAGIQGNRCFFGVAERNIAEPEILLSTLCHEVAHAWRAFHRLEVDDRDEEELLTDVTTVYLGFGILTTNGAYRYRTSGEFDGVNAIHRWSHQRTGYLTHQEMAFLLAVQSLARGMGWWERRHIAGMLETDQAYYYRRSIKILGRSRDLVAMFSSIAPTRKMPGSKSAHRPVRLSLSEKQTEETPAMARLNEGGFVYRVKRDKKGPYGFWGLVAGILVGLAAMYSGLGLQAIFAGGVLGLVMGVFTGASRPWDYCSDFQCQAVIPANAQECPRCGGTIRGILSHPNEQLDREETIKQENRS